MVEIERIPIVEMTNEDDVSKSIVRLPYCDIADIVSWVGERKPLAVIPPYSEDMRFTARAASMLRDRMPEVQIMCAVHSGSVSATQDFLRTFTGESFRVFALDSRIGDSPLEHLFPVAPEGVWYHLAGRKPMRELAGKWSWSEESL